MSGRTSDLRWRSQARRRPLGSRLVRSMARRASWRMRAHWLPPVALTACFLLFAVVVHLRMLDALDLAVRHASRPDDVWGPVQIRAARFVHTFPPTRIGAAFLAVVTVLGVLRRSLRPFVAVAVVAAPVVVLTLGTKWVMSHWHSGVWPVGHGSFPSGHTATVVVLFGLVVLLVRPGTRWGWTLPVLATLVMGSALILADIHPATDVLGGALLGGAALAGARVSGLEQWASGHRTDVVVS